MEIPLLPTSWLWQKDLSPTTPRGSNFILRKSWNSTNRNTGLASRPTNRHPTTRRTDGGPPSGKLVHIQKTSTLLPYLASTSQPLLPKRRQCSSLTGSQKGKKRQHDNLTYRLLPYPMDLYSHNLLKRNLQWKRLSRFMTYPMSK